MDFVTLARALHVLSIIHWIGGLSFVTLIVLPLALSRANATEGLQLFLAVERRFSVQVRISIPLAGVTGLWMTWRLDLWARFADPRFWWMSAMFGLWLIFMLMIFVAEPLLHRFLEEKAKYEPTRTMRRVTRLHLLLLAIAALTALGAIAGAHELNFF